MVMKASAAELEQERFGTGVKLKDFGPWMAAEQRRIYLLCLRMLRNSDEADSATQDVFVKAYRALDGAEKDAIETPARWLTRVAVNTCLDRLRSQRWLFWQRRAAFADEQAVLRLARAAGPDQEDNLHALEITRRLGMALEKLSFRQRSVFVLRHEEDCSLEEIGDILGLDIGTVKAHLARAIHKLRAELRDLYDRKTLGR
jgi:RNA polymerase sigma-70 factor (ECF subfamily)